ncbi:nitroreductase family protein [Nostocoides sp. F2B08]|uniref:nitroreductase family protein n=1 Tax=Nostocoides sp. F2B08 TaxID=2653936 RepID=UPI00126392A6|nr:nitroreductase family protein [Tetrasphaera sp. F2B08]KAB7742427.1 nitroreductase family protein [Tetrasphaera sp. F2B08]
MDLSDAVRRRRMCRRFDATRPVADEVLDDMLDLATRAPSAGHTQGWELLVLSAQAERRVFWDATRTDGYPDRWLEGVSAAPVLVLALSDPTAYLDRYAEPDKGWRDRSTERWPIPYWDTDTAMSVMILLLAAQERALGALFFGVPGALHDRVKEVLAIPDRLRIVGVVALGHPDPVRPTPRSPSLRRGRRGVERMVHRGRFGRH